MLNQKTKSNIYRLVSFARMRGTDAEKIQKRVQKRRKI